MAIGVKRPATYADLERLPEYLVGEITDGELHAFPRPRSRHARAAGALDRRLGPAFDDGITGPDGWWIVFEPELHLGQDVLVPDLAGWRREQMPEFPDVAYFEAPPDWVCEILSPSTSTFDRETKLPLYAHAGVDHAWLVDPIRCTLEALRRQAGTWLLVSTHTREEVVRADPFAAIELDLLPLWGAVRRP